MFAKPYKQKSNNALKNSEKKHLAQRVLDEFPFATEEKVKEIVPLKGSCSCIKLVLHSGDFVNVYVLNGIPMLIETSGGLVPTVCALWRVPDLVPVLTIHTQVLAKIQNGAPLYLPGVSLPAQGAGFPIFPCGTILAARTEDNAAACLVGSAAMSSADMLLRASGICLDTLHVYGDALCKDDKFNKIERPKPTSPESNSIPANLAGNFQQITLQAKEEWPSLGQRPVPPVKHQPQVIPVDTALPETETVDTQLPETETGDSEGADDSFLTAPGAPADMDALLKWCLLSFLKLRGKGVELPLKTNILYKHHLHVMCPPDRTLDVKKSSYKKVGKFLEAMQQEGLLEVRDLEKGVSAVTALNVAHPLARTHAIPDAVRQQAAQPAEEKEYVPPAVREVYCVTAHVQALLDLRRGTAVTSASARAALTEYARRRGLARGAGVALDATLAKLTNRPEQEVVKWEVLMTSLLGKMTAGTEMRFSDGTVKLTKAKLEPITMKVAVRSGNKKVTLVSNLESFGFKLSALAQACQRGVAASAGVTRAPGAAHDQLMLQGDQTHFMAKLLIEKYELPKKFVEGAEKALNKKK